MKKTSIGGLAVLSFLLWLLALGIPSSANAVEVTVDCDTPGTGDFDSISEALDAHDDTGGELRILANGTCEEGVLIKRDRVVLEGGTIDGSNEAVTVEIVGATGVVISDVTLRGVRGVRVSNQGAVEVVNPDIDVTRFGIHVRNQGFALVRCEKTPAECLIKGDRAAVFLSDFSSARIGDSTLRSSKGFRNTLALERNSSVRLEGVNSVKNTSSGGRAIFLLDGATIHQADGHTTVEGQVFISTLSFAALLNIEIRANGATPAVSVSQNSDLVFGDNSGASDNVTVTGGISIGDRSGLFIHGPIKLAGDIRCEHEPNTPKSAKGLVINKENVTFVSGKFKGCKKGK